MLRITSTQNPRVKLAIGLRNRRTRTRHSLFLIEGKRELERAVDAELPIEFVFAHEARSKDKTCTHLLDRLESNCNCEVALVDDSVLDKVCYRGSAASMVAVAPMFTLEVERLTTPSNSLFLIAVGMEKPGNLGSMLRSADAVKADGVIVCDENTDVFNPNVVRASLGTLFCVPVARTTLRSLVKWCKDRGVALVAASPESKTPYTRFDYTQSCGIVIGSESQGLGDEWSEVVDQVVQIPQMGKSDSLNAAMAATVMLFEARRQRIELQ